MSFSTLKFNSWFQGYFQLFLGSGWFYLIFRGCFCLFFIFFLHSKTINLSPKADNKEGSRVFLVYFFYIPADASAWRACHCLHYIPFKRRVLCTKAKEIARSSCLRVCCHILFHMVVCVSTEGGWTIINGRFCYFLCLLSLLRHQNIFQSLIFLFDFLPRLLLQKLIE